MRPDIAEERFELLQFCPVCGRHLRSVTEARVENRECERHGAFFIGGIRRGDAIIIFEPVGAEEVS